jgi:site-specific DNA-methyltransferase (adenine-specific)
MGSGATIAAAVAAGYESIGLEIDPNFFSIAEKAIPLLAKLPDNGPRRIPSGDARQARLELT